VAAVFGGAAGESSVPLFHVPLFHGEYIQQSGVSTVTPVTLARLGMHARLVHMKANTIQQIMGKTRPPLNFYTSDGRVVYVDHPESVLVSEPLVAIASGADASTGVAKEMILLSPDHIVRIEPTKRRPLRKVI
jgi:hypothetical protein